MENSADFYVPWAQLRANRPVAQRLQRSAVRSAAPAFQNGLRIGIGIDWQRDRQATAAFANELEDFAVHAMKYSTCSTLAFDQCSTSRVGIMVSKQTIRYQ